MYCIILYFYINTDQVIFIILHIILVLAVRILLCMY